MIIKVCGLQKEQDAQFLNECQVDLAGFVLFFPKSRRNISIEKAMSIFHFLSPSIQKVAVVVSPTMEQVTEIVQAGFDYIQIHGTLEEAVLQNCTIPILKAFNVSDLAQLEHFSHYPNIAGYVLDAQEPGSGKTFDWKLVQKLPRDGRLFLLAGGLHSENVSEAIELIHPDGVDVSSGVEYDDKSGKDPEKIRAFVSAVRTADYSDQI